MTESETLLQTFMKATEAFVRSAAEAAKTADPQSHAEGCGWLDSPGSKVELRIDLGGRLPTPTHTIRGLVVDEGGEALWQLFSVTTPSGNA